MSKTLLKELCVARGRDSKLLSTPSAGDCGGCSRCLRLLLHALCPTKIGEMKCILGPNTLLCYLSFLPVGRQNAILTVMGCE